MAFNLEDLDEVIVSDPEEEVFEFVWSLKKLAAVLQDESLVSPVFTSPINKTEWTVNVRKGTGYNHKLYVYIGLRLAAAQTPLPFPTVISSWMLNSKMEKLRILTFNPYNFTRNDELYEVPVCELSSFMNVNTSFLALDGSLNLHFRVTTTQYNPNNAKRETSHAVSATTNKETFKSLLENGDFSDLTLKTKTNSFPTSKILLAVQSPVFKAMFLSEMRESKENVVNIEDFSDETVTGLLEFLHAGKCESLEENTTELLKISDKYEVVNLKRACEKILIDTLSKENAADLLILASFYNSTLLKSKVTSFVKRCRKEVADTESFKQLKKLHPEILLDLYAEFD